MVGIFLKLIPFEFKGEEWQISNKTYFVRSKESLNIKLYGHTVKCEIMGSKFIEQSFIGSCWIIVGFMIGYWFYKYEVEDRDIGIVDYIPLEEANDIEFPMATLCLVQPFIEAEIKEIDINVNSSVYQDYLKGNILEESLHGLDQVVDGLGKLFKNENRVLFKTTLSWPIFPWP